MNRDLRLPIAVMILVLSTSMAFSQTRDKGKLIEYKNPFYDVIKEAVEGFDHVELLWALSNTAP